MSASDSTPTFKDLIRRTSEISIRSNGPSKSLGGGEIGGSVNNGAKAELSMVKRKKDFKCMERVNGRMVNVLEGLELHTGVFSAAEQQEIIGYVYELQEQGRKRQLRERTYSEPRKWMRGKGRVTIQLGCCYNYATDKHGNPPGIIRDEEVDPIPPLLKSMIKRMVAWRVLPPTCVPNSCIINIYEKDDCIPPHIDHHDFVRPFCTVSFLTECNILFGSELKVLGPGDFSGSTAIPLPVGSVLILKGNGADVAKHCVPAVPSKRISITFRKMDDSKLPFRFTPDPELQNLRPLPLSGNGHPIQQVGGHVSVSPVQQQYQHQSEDSDDQILSRKNQSTPSGGEKPASPFQFDRDDFPSLGSRIASRVSASPVQQQQQQAQHRTPPSQAQQASSQPSSWNSADHKSRISSAPVRERSEDQSRSEKNQSAAHGEKPVVSPCQLDEGNFPSLSSSAFSKPMRKPGRSLRQ